MKNKWKSVGTGVALIVLLAGVAYLPALTAGFVGFDDIQNVTGNQLLRTFDGLKRIWTDPQASFQYYPLTYTSFWLEHRLWGLHPAGYHAVNVLLHAVNAVLVWLLLNRLAVPGAWLAGLLFALHPVHVESVAWISERKNVLSGCFYLSSILVYLRFVGGTPRPRRMYALSLALFLCALLSKTSTVSMPFAVLLLLWWKRGRIKGHDVLALVPFFLAAAALGFLTAWVEVRYASAHGPEWQLSLLERCLIAGRVVWFYAGKLIWPYPLTLVYPRWQINTTVWWQYLFPCATVIVILALWRYRSQLGKAPLVAVLFFVVTLIPVPAFINIAFMRYSYVADHWQYLPSIGLIALAGALVETLVRERTARVSLTVVLAVMLGALSWQHSKTFHDPESLFRQNLACNPQSWLGHYNLGVLLVETGNVQEAKQHYEQALQIKPDYVEAHNNLGMVLLDSGSLTEAVGQFEQALRLRAAYPEAQYNLGIALYRLGKVPQAIQHYEQALRLKPDNAEAHNNLAIALAGSGNLPKAIQHYELALRIKPEYPEAHHNLGNALLTHGRPGEAAVQFEWWLRLKPGDAEVHSRLGVALFQSGRIQDAIGHYEQALRLKPDLAETQNNLAWALATLPKAKGGDPVRSVSLAQRACELTGNRIAANLDTLAVAYAAAGRFPEAIDTARKAIELARSDGQTQLVSEIEARLGLYRARRDRRGTE